MSIIDNNEPYADFDKATLADFDKAMLEQLDDRAPVNHITEKQIDFIIELCHQTGNEIPAYLDVMERKNASALIGDLIKARDSQKAAPVPAKTATGIDFDNSVLSGGYFTVTDSQGHRTFRVSPNQKWCDGKTVISALTGPNNEWSYTGIGFVHGNGVKLWAKFASDSRMANLVERLVADAEGAKQLTLDMAAQHVLTSKNCFACGKLLTDPTSIAMGIGPVCREF